ncbi:MAG: YbbC/YhhH family protein [Candidatus Omnitrophota bacterium]
MKKTIILSLMMVFFSVSFLSAAEKHSYKPENGYVPDQATAVKIAEAVLIPIYSEKTIADEKPLKAELKDGIWIVEGTLPCPEGQRCVGGVAVIEISKDDGKILRVSHGK